MAERIDTTPPITEALLIGEKGEDGWYRSDVNLILLTQDGEGLGVDYTLYRIVDDDWGEYKEPIIFTEEGEYKVEFYSVDKDENIEETRLVEFNIDKTFPALTLLVEPLILWPPDGKTIDINISGSVIDNYFKNVVFTVEDEYNEIEPIIANFGDIIKLEASRKGKDLDGRKYEIKVDAFDLAGNSSASGAAVLVPHDQSN